MFTTQHTAPGLVTSESDGPLLVNADAVARMMSVSVRTLWRLLSAGQLVPPLRLGRSVRWRKAEIEAWIQAGCPAPATGLSRRK